MPQVWVLSDWTQDETGAWVMRAALDYPGEWTDMGGQHEPAGATVALVDLPAGVGLGPEVVVIAASEDYVPPPPAKDAAGQAVEDALAEAERARLIDEAKMDPALVLAEWDKMSAEDAIALAKAAVRAREAEEAKLGDGVKAEQALIDEKAGAGALIGGQEKR